MVLYDEWRKGDLKMSCNSIIDSLCILPNGDVPLCQNLDVKIGNLFNNTLDEIKENKYKLIECSENVYEELISRVDDQLIETMKIQTFYESIWLKENKTIKYLAFSI